MIIKKQEKKGIKLSLSKNKIKAVKKKIIIKKLPTKIKKESVLIKNKEVIPSNLKEKKRKTPIVEPKKIIKNKQDVVKKTLVVKKLQKEDIVEKTLESQKPTKGLYCEQSEKQGSGAKRTGSYCEKSEQQGSAQSAGPYCEKSEQQGSAQSADSYIEAIGKRKTSVARVRIFKKGKGIFLINNSSFEEYCPNVYHRKILDIVLEIIRSNQISNRPDITIIVKGGGFHSQIEAIRHGIAKISAKLDEGAKKKVKQLGYLTRDARMRERKKPGLKRARKATQWRKR